MDGQLLQRWVAVLGSGEDVVAAGRALLVRYTQEHRRYHDLRHLAEVLQALDLLEPGPPPAPVLAAFWHDAVYDPRAGDNERASAELATTTLAALGLPEPLSIEVARLVLLTAGHDPAPEDAAGAVLCDADLAVLAAAPARYGAYARDVRQEYAHLSDPVFRAGRSAVLRGLLDRPHLFSTGEGRRRWERPARDNLHAELARLSGPCADAARRP
ncbi:MAG TPA: metal-dependent phosphohydrolase [Mycobacteriales bacterium]|nr:metal-dependent phosphohydrolase [Mycobacteriales bacterium]